MVDLVVTKRRHDGRGLFDDPGDCLVHEEVDLPFDDQHVLLVHPRRKRAIDGRDEHVEARSEELRGLRKRAIDRSASGLVLVVVHVEDIGNLVGRPLGPEILQHAGAAGDERKRSNQRQ